VRSIKENRDIEINSLNEQLIDKGSECKKMESKMAKLTDEIGDLARQAQNDKNQLSEML